MLPHEPLSPDVATALIKRIAREEDVAWTTHATDAIRARGLATGDCLNVMRCGAVVQPPDLEHGTWRYQIHQPDLRRGRISFCNRDSSRYGVED